MAKPDIRYGFYIIPVHNLTIDLLGFQKKEIILSCDRYTPR